MNTTLYILITCYFACLPLCLMATIDSLELEKLINTARQQANEHQYEKAIETNNSLIPLLQAFYQVKENKAIASTYSRIGNCQIDLGLYAQAEQSHSIALEMRKKLFGEDAYAVGTSYNNLGISYINQGLYEEALKMQQAALKNRIQTRGKEHIKTARSYENIAICYEMLKDFGLSIRYYEKALIILKQELESDDIEICELYDNMAGCWRKMQHFENAMDNWKYAEHILLKQENVDSLNLAKLSNNIGYCYYNLGCYTDAIRYLNQAIEVYAQILPLDHLKVGHAVENLSYVYSETGDWEKANYYAQRALKIHSKKDNYNSLEVAAAFENLAMIAMNQGDLNQATELLDSAKQVIRPLISDTDKLSASAFDMELNSDIAAVLLRKYHSSKQVDELKKALQYSLESVKIIDKYRLSNQTEQAKTYLNARVLPIYERGIEAAYLLQQAFPNRDYKVIILKLIEKSKSIVLHEAMQRSKASLVANLPETLVQTESDLQHEIATLQKEQYEIKSAYYLDTIALHDVQRKLFDVQQERDDFLTNLQKTYPKYFQLKYDTTTIDFVEIQQKLAQNQTLVEYFLGREHTYALVIDKEKITIRQWENGQSLSALTTDFQRSVYLYNPSISIGDNYAQTAFALHNRLVAPIADLLSERVIIIPDGQMGYIPFAALIDELPSDYKSFQNYAYLVKKHQFSYVHSAALFANYYGTNQGNGSKNLLAIAPSFTNSQPIALRSSGQQIQGNLKFNVEESRTVTEHWNGDLVIAETATKEYFLAEASEYNFLHLSTHGQADDNNGDFANLAFTGTSPDNLLYLREIYNLRLNADMVVLSACETGIGPLRKGDGIISLARGFTYAGAKSIITTLWKINDRTSVYLMDQFYQQLLTKKSKDVALQQSQLNYISEQPTHLTHPFYWAAFIPIGNMEVVQPMSLFTNRFWIIGTAIMVCLFLIPFYAKSYLNINQ